MIHYHGTPITPQGVLETLAGRHFCVSYATPHQVETCHRIGQSVMLDNGAFTFWRRGSRVDVGWWWNYYAWAKPWLDYHTTWAVIPDVIDGTEEDNDNLLLRFCRRFGAQGAPVWHMHESLDRLVRLTVGYRRVCIGSSGVYSDPSSASWRHRMDEVFNRLCPTSSKTPVPIHMLRAMDQACNGPWPFASADSTNTAQNHHRPQETALRIVSRWDAKQAPARWTVREQMELAA